MLIIIFADIYYAAEYCYYFDENWAWYKCKSNLGFVWWVCNILKIIWSRALVLYLKQRDPLVYTLPALGDYSVHYLVHLEVNLNPFIGVCYNRAPSSRSGSTMKSTMFWSPNFVVVMVRARCNLVIFNEVISKASAAQSCSIFSVCDFKDIQPFVKTVHQRTRRRWRGSRVSLGCRWISCFLLVLLLLNCYCYFVIVTRHKARSYGVHQGENSQESTEWSTAAHGWWQHRWGQLAAGWKVAGKSENTTQILL